MICLRLGPLQHRELAKQTGGRGGWDVIADDHYVLREFCDWAAQIPYMAGSVMSEFNSNLAKGEFTKNDWSTQEVDQRLSAAALETRRTISWRSSRRFSHKRRFRTHYS